MQKMQSADEPSTTEQSDVWRLYHRIFDTFDRHFDTLLLTFDSVTFDI